VTLTLRTLDANSSLLNVPESGDEQMPAEDGAVNRHPNPRPDPDTTIPNPVTGTSAVLMPTEARGNYLPEPPYLRETKTYHSQPLESIRHASNYFVPLSIRPIFIFFVAEVMSNYLTNDGLKKISILPEAPLRPEARGICHICHMVNPALSNPRP